MSATPSDMPREPLREPGSDEPAGSAALTGITELFGLEGRKKQPPWSGGSVEKGPRDSASPDADDTAGRWVAATEGTIANTADASGRLVAGRYRLIAELGTGGMGITYRAWDTRAGIPVVVKMPRREVRHDREVMARFAREIEAMRALPHPAIVPITDSGDDAGCPYVVMRFLPGGSLADYRRRDESDRPIKNPPGMLHFWLPGVAAALDHIHARRMLHRDVKPGNIFLDGFLKPFLGDFGIAKVVDDSGGLQKEQTLTATKMAVGTPEYMAPEFFKPRTQLDGRVDQYALAVTVYEMLCGEKPFTGSTAHIIVEHSSLPVPLLDRRCPGLPWRVYDAVHRALAKNPEERFATCREFAEAVLLDLKPLAAETDTVRLLCPSCRNVLKLPQKAAGKSGKCPRCQVAMDVASDLGSLWLESEERGGGGVEPARQAEVPDDSEDPFPEDLFPIENTPRRRRWGNREWAAVMLAACGGLMLGYPWGSSVTAAKTWQEFRAMETAFNRATAENQRLTRDLEQLHRSQAALAALAPNSSPSASSTSVTSRPAPGVPPGIETLTNSIGIRLNLCPSGTFTMGDASGESDETPHPVTLTKPFYLGVYEVTNAQWKQVMGNMPSSWKDDDRPVESVSWGDAEEFCRKLSALPAEQQAGRVYRLPTEAEWEYACRAGTTTKYSFGDDASGLGEYGWFDGNSGSQTHTVGTKKPNAWGLYDMHGNVWEWCSDWYGDYPKGAVTDPQGPSKASGRVCRGGSWYHTARLCRSANRCGYDPSYRNRYLGFRLALSPSGVQPVPPEAGAVASPAPTNPPPNPVYLTQYRDSVGKTLSFTVVGSLSGGSVWGSNPYTADSALSSAAVHAGVLKPAETGVVRVTVLPGQQSYEGTARNGVTTSRYGGYPLSYRIEGGEAGSSAPSQNWYERELREIGPDPGPIASTGRPVERVDQLALGQVLQVKWGNSWWGARVLEIRADGRVKVRYLGWHPRHDTVVELASLQFDEQAEDKARRIRPNPVYLTQYRDSVGKTLSFTVVGSLSGGSVWGSNPYTADSALSSAAVHAGVLKPAETGVVRVTILPGQQSYEGTARNGVTTSRYGGYPLSYRIEGGEAVKSPPQPALAPNPSPSASSTSVTSRPAPEVPPGIETLTNSIGIRFNLCPSGTFTMGDASGASDETPHQVTLTKPFYMGVYEVTNAQWKQVMGNMPSTWKENDRPVESVSWGDAEEFCRKLSALPAERQAGRMYRLPTEAEWEYACRAGTTTKYSFGDDASGLGEYGWFDGNSGSQTHTVGTKKPNAWGLYDMHGNVWEWCSDWYGAYPKGAVTDPQGPSKASARVGRGGSWYCPARNCRSASRYGFDPSSRYSHLGFRLALSPSGVQPVPPEAGAER